MGTAQWAFLSKGFKYLALSCLLNWSPLNCLSSCRDLECWVKLGFAWAGVGACSLVNCSSSLFCCAGGKHMGEGKHRPVKDYISAMSQPQRNLNFSLLVLGWATSYYQCRWNPWVCRALCWRQTWYHDRNLFGILADLTATAATPAHLKVQSNEIFSNLIPDPGLCVWVV